MRRFLVPALVLAAAGAAGAAAAPPEPVRLVEDGGRVAWHRGPAHDLIAFDALLGRGRGNTEVYVIRPDGSDRRCVTCDAPAIRKGFVGQPAWHPGGEHLVIQVENENSGHRLYNHVSFGIDNDLWLIRRDGTGARRIWATADKHAALHPHFSRDGRQLIFAERVPTGRKLARPLLRRMAPGGESQWEGWRVHVADVDLAREADAVLSNHRTLQPSGPGFYETHGFAPDGRIVYSFTSGGGAYVDDCYSAAPDGSDVRNLIRSPGTWEEHAQYAPDGQRMAFISSRADPSLRFPETRPRGLRTELYLIEGGGAPRALTAMNERLGRAVVVSDFDWDREGRRIVFQVADMDRSHPPSVWMVDLGSTPTAPRPASAAAARGARVSVLTPDGGHVDWLPNGPIVFDRAGRDGYFDLWTMNADGSGQRALTDGKPELPGRHVGQPAWHPSGRYVAFQAQKAGIPKDREGTMEPGAGVLNDLWIMNAEATRFWKIVDLRFDLSADAPAILHPHFSHDGKRILWAERIGRGPTFGSWVMRLADFGIDGGTPRVSNVRTLTPGQSGPRPGEGAFYETHGFSPDDTHVLYSSNVEQGLKIYEMELQSGRVRRLTHDPRVWDEHAQYSPDGTRIVYMSSESLVFRVTPFELQAEFWIMDRDGGGKRRLTFFHEPGHPHYRGGGFAVAADSAWRADGRAFAGLVIRHRPDTDRRGEGEIVLVEVN